MKPNDRQLLHDALERYLIDVNGEYQYARQLNLDILQDRLACRVADIQRLLRALESDKPFEVI